MDQGRDWAGVAGSAAAGWVAARVLLVLVALTFLPHGFPVTGDAPHAEGLFAWDAGWYRAIAEHGYAALPHQAVRFFPLLPMSASVLHWAGVPVRWGLPVIANLCALGYATVLGQLVGEVTANPRLGRRTALLAQLAPGAAVLALPYTEALAGLVTVIFFLGLQRRDPRLCLAGGLLAGAARPTGILLAVPALVVMVFGEARARRAAGTGLAGAIGGTGAYLCWVGVAYGDPLLPYRLQGDPHNRGGVLSSPWLGLTQDAPGSLPWWANVLLVVTLLTLLVVASRVLPSEYWTWAAVMLLAAGTSASLRSLPRYAAATFPLLVAAATLPRRRISWRLSVLGGAAGMTALAWIGFGPHYVP